MLIHTFFICGDPCFADRAGVLALEPGRDTLGMETMEAGQDDVLLFHLVVGLADRTLLVLFRKVDCICCRELICWKHID